MKDIIDFIWAVCILACIMAFWVMVPVFGAILGTGFALLFIFAMLKEHREEKERGEDDSTGS